MADLHLNEYELNRAYGGPEEGGWWYDTGKFVRCHGVFSSWESAFEKREELVEYLAERRVDCHEPSSVACQGWPSISIEIRPGENFPKTPPRYT